MTTQQGRRIAEVHDPGLRKTGYGPTRICDLDEANVQVRIFGYPLEELARHCSFEEVAWLTLHGELPDKDEYAQFISELASARAEIFREISPRGRYRTQLRLLKRDAHPMDMLRTLVSLLGANELSRSSDFDSLEHATRMLAAMPIFTAAIARYQKNLPIVPVRFLRNQEHLLRYSCARLFLALLRGTPPQDKEVRALDISLSIYTEHEFNAGTHILHAIASTNSDMYSAVIGGGCGLKGDAHGGANEAALTLLENIGTAERAEEVIDGILAHAEEGATIKGFGHGVYKRGDPRCAVLKPLVQELARAKKGESFYEPANTVEQTVFAKKGLHSNVDFWSAPLYALLDIPKGIFTPLFETARTVGWCAHYREYRELNRVKGRIILLRPRPTEYIGPPLRHCPAVTS